MSVEVGQRVETAFGDSAAVLRRFSAESLASACWRRALPKDVREDAGRLRDGPAFRRLVPVDGRRPDQAVAAVLESLDAPALARDLRQLLAMHDALLPGAARRLRLERVADDGCRRFHADHVGSRLLCSYAGPGTVCLPPHAVDALRPADGTDAHVLEADAAWCAEAGWVLMMRGSAGSGPAQFHRSPSCGPDGPRLLVAIDA